jgi:capsule polysaccharide export protein KpsE/RkpR
MRCGGNREASWGSSVEDERSGENKIQGVPMDKKQKKRIQTLNQRIQSLRQQLAGARRQMDDPAEVKTLEQQIAAAEAELEKAKKE